VRVIRAEDNTAEAINNALTSLANGTGGGDIVDGINDGFMISQYQITFQRTVQNQYFLNVPDAIAILGRGQGQLTLSGLVGKADALATLLGSTPSADGKKGTSGSFVEDFCHPLCIMISGTTQMNDCSTTDKNAGAVFLCGNVIIQQFAITGQTQADGAEMQSANLVGTFTRLDMKSGSPLTKAQTSAAIGAAATGAFYSVADILDADRQ
jgi:hypothetical protein